MAEARAEQPMEGMSDVMGEGPGRTIIADGVVAKIASIAAREVPGVHELGGATQRALGGAISRITGTTGAPPTAGVSVEVGEAEAAVDLAMVIDYGQSIPDIATKVRENVMNQINSLTGLRVKEVNITVNDLYFPEEESQQEQGQSEQRVA